MFVFQLQRARRGGQIRSLDSESATKPWQLQCLERKTIDISKSFQPKGRIPRKSVQSTNTFSEGGPKTGCRESWLRSLWKLWEQGAQHEAEPSLWAGRQAVKEILSFIWRKSWAHPLGWLWVPYSHPKAHIHKGQYSGGERVYALPEKFLPVG